MRYGYASNTYYVPKSKKDLVQWFVDNKGWVKSRLNKMTIKQLFAVYHKERRNHAQQTS